MFKKWNDNVKKLSFLDIKLIKWATFFMSIAIVKFFPQLLKIDYWVLILLAVLCSLRPFYRFWIKD